MLLIMREGALMTAFNTYIEGDENISWDHFISFSSPSDENEGSFNTGLLHYFVQLADFDMMRPPSKFLWLWLWL